MTERYRVPLCGSGNVAGPRYRSVMIDHIGVQVADVEASLAFYLRTFEPIGMREAMRIPTGATFVVGLSGLDGVPSFCLSQGSASETRELHLPFHAADRSAVDAVHQAAVTAGPEVVHAPRGRHRA